MLKEILTIVIAAAITGPAGYMFKTLFTRNRYLPELAADRKAYSFINGDWFFYHFTCDPTTSPREILSVDKVALVLEKDLIVVGKDQVVGGNRSALHYKLRGEIRSGQLFLTGICIEDPSDAYTCIFPNLLNDESEGVMIALDYARKLYASATLITKRPFTVSEAKKKLRQSGVRLYGSNLEVRDKTRTSRGAVPKTR
jgi:hypothetical protein